MQIIRHSPAQAGSVIAFVSHEEPNDIPFAQANAFDMKWATITTYVFDTRKIVAAHTETFSFRLFSGRLNITQIGPLPFDL